MWQGKSGYSAAISDKNSWADNGKPTRTNKFITDTTGSTHGRFKCFPQKTC